VFINSRNPFPLAALLMALASALSYLMATRFSPFSKQMASFPPPGHRLSPPIYKLDSTRKRKPNTMIWKWKRTGRLPAQSAIFLYLAPQSSNSPQNHAALTDSWLNSAVGREADNVKFGKFDRSLFESDAVADSCIRRGTVRMMMYRFRANTWAL
jgi:hypothetical protein